MSPHIVWRSIVCACIMAACTGGSDKPLALRSEAVSAVRDPGEAGPYAIGHTGCLSPASTPSGEPAPVELVERVVMQVAAALDGLHRAGAIHRDVKPANILLDRARDRAVLVDVGVARREDSSADAAGTPGFAAPESCHARRGGPGTDVYGLAAASAAGNADQPERQRHQAKARDQADAEGLAQHCEKSLFSGDFAPRLGPDRPPGGARTSEGRRAGSRPARHLRVEGPTHAAESALASALSKETHT